MEDPSIVLPFLGIEVDTKVLKRLLYMSIELRPGILSDQCQHPDALTTETLGPQMVPRGELLELGQ